MKKQSCHGFGIVGVIGVSLLTSLSAFAVLEYKKNIDIDTRRAYVQHLQGLSIETIRDQIMAVMRDAENNEEVDHFITGTIANFKLLLENGLECPSKNPCSFYIERYSVDSDTRIATFEIAIKHADNSPSKLFKSREFNVKLPDVTAENRPKDQSPKALLCTDIKKPLFRGTTIGPHGNIVPNCVALEPSNSSRHFKLVDKEKNSIGYECDTAAGYWMTKIKADATPECLLFPEGITTEKVAEVGCPEGQYAQSVKFTAELKVEQSVICVPKGVPYDYSGTNRRISSGP